MRPYALYCFLAVAIFAAGRFSAPEKIKIQKEIVTVEKKVIEADLHRDTVVTHTVKPDGTQETVSHTVEDSQKHVALDLSVATKESREVENKSQLSTSLLIGRDVYGVHIDRSILGPVTLGIWAMKPTAYGFSIGLLL